MYFNKKFTIDGREIGEGCKPYIIAEMSANHGNDFNRAIAIIKKAKECGADAVKIQTYSADTMTIDCKKEPFEAKGAWSGQYLYDLYIDASTPWEWTEKLQEVAKEVGITLFSTPFDFSSIEYLQKLNMPAYKIASPEIVDLALVRKIAQTKKPIILSTGNATIAQINEAVGVMIKEGVKDLAILKCTSEYPAPAKEINLKSIPFLKGMFHCPVGLSDHTLGSAIPIASVGFQADIIEKHFILDRTETTADSFFSATPEELKAIVDGSALVFEAIGEVSFPIVPKPSQRSLIITKDMQKGEILQENINFRSIRPGGGIESKDIQKIASRKITQDVHRGTLLSWDLVGGF
jgi:pseudaminic acid synthase